MLFSLTISALLLSLVFQSLLALTQGAHVLGHQFETAAMWNNASRVLREDVHAASTLNISAGVLNLKEADGRVFRYVVNPSGQLVRTQSGGGTAVVAVGVTAMSGTALNQVLSLRLVFQGGFSGDLVVSPLP